MMIRILRSDAVVKLANRLLRTYSPGLLSGSTLMGIMAGGPFSPWGQQTGGMGGLLYPFPTGEATEVCKKKKRRKTRWKTALFSQTQDRLSHRQISQYRITEKFPNMVIEFSTCWTFRDCPKGTSLPWVCSFFPNATPNRACRNENTAAMNGCFPFVAKMSLTVDGSKTLEHGATLDTTRPAFSSDGWTAIKVNPQH